MAEIVNDVNCPMMNKIIELGYCVELQMITDGAILPTENEQYLTDTHFKLCQDCPKRIDPTK